MDDNKKFSIREYREALYADIVKRKKQQRKKWQAKYLQKLGVTDTAQLENASEKIQKEEDTEAYKQMMRKNEQKYNRPVTSSVEKRKDDSKKKGMDYAQYK